MRYQKRERFIYDDNDNELVWCFRHQDYLMHTEFDLSNDNDSGYMMFCKECRLSHKEKMSGVGVSRKTTEVESSNILLKCIGYEPNNELTIYEQFLMKHHEKINQEKVYKKRTKKKRT
jgi:hypothetical protein